MATTLVVNPGSSSRKYALFHDGKVMLEFSFEGTGTGYEVCLQKADGRQTCEPITVPDFDNAFARVKDAVSAYCTEQKVSLDVISLRLVVPGTAFAKHRFIDAVCLSEIYSYEFSAPLHIPAIIREVEACRLHFPKVTLVGVSDSAFHATLPPIARRYSLKAADAAELDLYRFGYHGLSVSSVVHRVHAVTGKDYDRLIVCHVGNGVSITALKAGVSIETSMGYSPLSGVPMGTRASDLDPGVLLELMKKKNLRLFELSVYLHKNGGLSGLAGEGDIRHLLERRSKMDSVATEALDTFTYHIQKQIAAASVATAGIDAIVFTGTAAQRSAELRKLICSKLGYLGIEIDEDKNDLMVGKEGVINTKTSPVKVVVMKTDEMREMAVAAELFAQSK
ncbi:MAG: acetate kinase [Candidatus Parcubacteria bacterium]|jgi:acetate kinase